MLFKAVLIPAAGATVLLTIAASVWADAAPASDNALLNAPERDLHWFRDAKFGMFITWGPVTLKGTEISWSRAGKRPGFEIPGDPEGTIPIDEYDNLYKRLNPTEFDADKWMDLARSAGMRYVVFVTKHHDGFCMFDTNALGEIEPLQVQRLKEMGAWLRRYGKSIYSTRGGPFILGKTGGSCYKGNTIYLHVLDWPQDTLRLPAIAPKIRSARALTGGEVTWKQSDTAIELSVPKASRDEIDTIIELKLTSSAADIKPIRAGSSPAGS
jgi:alpha-L-fucosidase